MRARRRLGTRYGVVALVVVGNLASLPLVDRGASFLREPDANWQVTERADTADIVELGGRLENVEQTHNVFMALEPVAEGADVHVLGEVDELDVGGKYRDRLVGFVRPSSLTFDRDLDPSVAESVVAQLDGTDHMSRTGTIWTDPTGEADGKPGHRWRLYLGSDDVDELWIMTTTEDDGRSTMHVVDASLLPAETRGEVRGW